METGSTSRVRTAEAGVSEVESDVMAPDCKLALEPVSRVMLPGCASSTSAF